MRTLPKALRRSVVPVPEFARRALDKLIPYQGRLVQQLADVLRDLGGSGISASDFRPEALPTHLKFNFAAVDKKGKVIDSDRDLAQLVKRQAGSISSSVSQLGRAQESAAVNEWTEETLGSVDEEVATVVDGHEVVAYPALVTTPDGIAVKVHATKAAADSAMITTTLTLLMREISVNTTQMIKGLPLQQRVAIDNRSEERRVGKECRYGGSQGMA